jgi:MFS family permease
MGAVGLVAGYAEVLRLPHAARVFVPALVGKLSYSMVVLATILAVEHATGSFAAAGVATGAFGLANVVAAPARARFIDRAGQRVALNSLAIVFGLGTAGLALATMLPDPALLPIVGLGVLAGASSPPVGAAMRVLWSDLAPTPQLKARAYSLDAVFEEVLFTAGPLVVSLVVMLAGAPSGLFATAATGVIGTLVMTSGAASRRRTAVAARADRSKAPLRQPRFVPLLVALLGTGIVIGAIEVGVPAAADGLPTLVTGALMAMMPIGSATGGLVYGQRAWRSRAVVRLVVISVGIALACAVAAVAPNLVALAVVLVVVGLFIAPGLITGYLLADELTHPDVQTEASSWVNTATNLGAASASAVAGWLVESVSVESTFVMGAGAALVTALIAAPYLLRRSRVVSTSLPA